MKGLPYLCRLFKASTGIERKHILLEELAHDVHNCNTFHYALEATPHDLLCDEEAYEAFYHQDEDLFESEEEGPNAGWTWANNNKGRACFRNGKCGQGLVEPVTATVTV
jgi:hypothetical protein